MKPSIFPILIFLFAGLMPTAIAGQTVDKDGVSVSSTYVPDLSVFPKAKERKRKKSPNQQALTVPPATDGRDVWLSLTVLDDRFAPVADIKASDVEVMIDGESRNIMEIGSGPDSVEVVFVVDTSPSTAIKVEDIRHFLEIVIAKLPASQKISIWKFDSNAQMLVEGSTDRTAIGKAVRKLKMDSGTSLYDTIEQLCSEKKQVSHRPKAVFFISDGVDTTSKDSDAAGSLLRTNECNDAYFPVYLDTYQFHADLVKKPPRVIANIPGLGPVFNAPPIKKEDFDLGRQYLGMLLKMTGGRAFLFPSSKPEAEKIATSVASVAKGLYTMRVNVVSAKPSMAIKVLVKRPNLHVLTKSVVEAGK